MSGILFSGEVFKLLFNFLAIQPIIIAFGLMVLVPVPSIVSLLFPHNIRAIRIFLAIKQTRACSRASIVFRFWIARRCARSPVIATDPFKSSTAKNCRCGAGSRGWIPERSFIFIDRQRSSPELVRSTGDVVTRDRDELAGLRQKFWRDGQL